MEVPRLGSVGGRHVRQFAEVARVRAALASPAVRRLASLRRLTGLAADPRTRGRATHARAGPRGARRAEGDYAVATSRTRAVVAQILSRAPPVARAAHVCSKGGYRVAAWPEPLPFDPQAR